MATKVCPVRLPEEQATALKDRHGSVTAGIRAAVNAYLWEGPAAPQTAARPAEPEAPKPARKPRKSEGPTPEPEAGPTPTQSAAREFLSDRPRPGKRPLNPRQSGR